MRIIISSIFMFLGLSVLLWIGAKSAPIPAASMPICKIIIPYDYLQNGWQFYDPAENGNISDLVRDGKAEITELLGHIECTRYDANQTPVTELGALAMWRKL